jgi:hypothetical protein
VGIESSTLTKIIQSEIADAATFSIFLRRCGPFNLSPVHSRLTFVQGQKAFVTPRSAGARAG